MDELFFFTEDCEMPSFFSEEKIRKWLRVVASDYSRKIGAISFIFCSDPYIWM